jgi:DNA-binding transcriptional LysR family regulator
VGGISSCEVELRHLRYFQALAEELNFSRAADRVHIVQSALSRQIAALEQELNVKLFERTSRGVELTPAGRALKDRIDAILPSLDEALEITRLTASGDLGRLEIGFIAAAMWSVLPPLLREHRRRHPSIAFGLHELPIGGEHLAPLIDGTLDAAIVRPTGLFRTLAFKPLHREQFVAVLPAAHSLAAHDAIDLAQLAHERFILMSRTAYPEAHDLYQQACLAAGFTPEIVDQGDSPNALYMVAVGFGVALAPASIQASGLPGLAFRRFSHPTPELELAIAYRKSRRSDALAELLETAAVIAEGGAGGVAGDTPETSPSAGQEPGTISPFDQWPARIVS